MISRRGNCVPSPTNRAATATSSCPCASEACLASQHGLQSSFEFRRIIEAYRAFTNHTVLIDENCRGDTPQAELILYGHRSHQQLVMYAQLLRKHLQIFRCIHREADSDDDQAPRAIALLKLLVCGHLCLARAAPRCPKIN